MSDEPRSELLTPPVDEKVELDKYGSPDIVRAEAEVSVLIVCFDYGVYETVSFGDGVVRFGWEGRIEEWRRGGGIVGERRR